MSDQEDKNGQPSAETPRRGARRKRVLKGARLVLGGGLSTIDCTIKDISATGARIRMMDVTQLSGKLRVAMPDGEMLDAEVIRNTGVELGLRFIGDRRPSFAPPPDALEEVILALDRMPVKALIKQIMGLKEHEDPEVAEATREFATAEDKLANILRARVMGW